MTRHSQALVLTPADVSPSLGREFAQLAERARQSTEVAVHEERRRLALQLHDTVGAMLFAIGARVRRLGDDLADDPDLSAKLKVIERQAAEAAAALRESLRTLHAAPDSLTLAVALRADCRSFEERSGIPIRLLVRDEVPPLHASRTKALVAAAREALLNVEKHAGALAVLVNVFCARNGVTVAVHDDGDGLPANWEDRAGLGLAGAGDRLGRVGGQISIGRNDDGGVTVLAWVPC